MLKKSPIYKYITPIGLLFFSFLIFSCSKNEDVRMPENILGIWSPSDTIFFEFCEKNMVHRLIIEQQDGESIGIWDEEVYYYEPGYNLVIYLSAEHSADVYQIVDLNSEQMTWCWVKNIRLSGASQIGNVIGDIIKEAQEGFKLDPELYQHFKRLSEDQFLMMLEKLDITYPWDFDF